MLLQTKTKDAVSATFSIDKLFIKSEGIKRFENVETGRHPKDPLFHNVHAFRS